MNSPTTCCDYMWWSFRNSKTFNLGRTSCEEEPIEHIYGGYYKIKLIETNTRIIIKIYCILCGNKHKNKFELLSLDSIVVDKQITNTLTMVRRK
jgi:hypothetical protein